MRMFSKNFCGCLVATKKLHLNKTREKSSEENKQPIALIYKPKEANSSCPLRNGEGVDVDLEITDDKYVKPREVHWILRRIFILTWIRLYDREKAIADLIAGVTLGLTITPQSIAYAALAGLSSEYGLYSAFVGCIIYVFFGTIPQVSIGPTSLMAIMVLQYCSDKPIQFVIVLSFLGGLVELLMGIFRLGFIISFIPSPVTKAFTTGTALIVVLAQVKSLLGIRTKGMPNPMEFWEGIQVADAAMGLTSLIILLLLKKLSSVSFNIQSANMRRLKKLLWYISISRNALLVFSCGLIAFLWIHKSALKAPPFALSSKVDSGIPSISLPPFQFEHNNRTYVFTDICRELGSGIIVVPIVAVLANVAIAKAFVKDGQLDASQEMFTLGLCNLAGSFFSAMPTCGAFTRSAVSQASGVRTPMAGIYTGLIVLSALSILTPYFQYIPKSSLSAVLIAAVVFMVDFKPMKTFWQANKRDFVSWCGCVLVCLLAGVEMGLLYGIVLNMIFVLLRLGNPKLEIGLKECDNFFYIYIKPLSDIYFSGVDNLRTEIRAACSLYKNDFPIVVDCSRFMLFDATFIEMINAVAKELHENDLILVLQSLSLKQQQLLPIHANIRFVNDNFITSDDLMAAKENTMSQKL